MLPAKQAPSPTPGPLPNPPSCMVDISNLTGEYINLCILTWKNCRQTVKTLRLASGPYWGVFAVKRDSRQTVKPSPICVRP